MLQSYFLLGAPILFSIFEAESAERALSILEKEHIDLVLLDIRMSRMQGSEAAHIIKVKYPNTKIIVITAYPEEGKKLSAENILDGLFIKPVGIQNLYAKLMDVLAVHETSLLNLQHKQGIRARLSNQCKDCLPGYIAGDRPDLPRILQGFVRKGRIL